MTTKQQLAAATKRAGALARVAGKRATKRLIEAADAALVAQGKAAKARQRKRALNAALTTMGKTMAMAGVAAGTVVAVRAGARALRRRAGPKV